MKAWFLGFLRRRRRKINARRWWAVERVAKCIAGVAPAELFSHVFMSVGNVFSTNASGSRPQLISMEGEEEVAAAFSLCQRDIAETGDVSRALAEFCMYCMYRPWNAQVDKTKVAGGIADFAMHLIAVADAAFTQQALRQVCKDRIRDQLGLAILARDERKARKLLSRTWRSLKLPAGDDLASSDVLESLYKKAISTHWKRWWICAWYFRRKTRRRKEAKEASRRARESRPFVLGKSSK